jgi:hypothetical protein
LVLPHQVDRWLQRRALTPERCYRLVALLSEHLARPLSVAPPCSTARSRDEELIASAVQALEEGDARAARRTMHMLAAPARMTPIGMDRALGIIASLGIATCDGRQKDMTTPASPHP